MLYLTDGQAVENLKAYVHGGGLLWGTYMLGTVDENDLCYLGGIPGSDLKAVFGIISEEIDTLYPTERRHAAMGQASHELVDYCETVHPGTAKVLAAYTDGYYAGMAAVTENSYGSGTALYQACRDTGTLASQVMDKLIAEYNIPRNLAAPLPHGLTAHSRTDGSHRYLFVENYSTEPACVTLNAPMEDLLTGQRTQNLRLGSYGFCILRNET